ncbi:MAG: hypothetical protein KBG19_06735, partial [Bacteroidales bacterium]|nr:hypothetical protein [Bacteroidales bacterium]
MPGTQTVGSLNIALLDLIINGNLCDGKFYMDVSPSIYIADGEDNVLGVKFEIKNPYGVIVKPYSGSYEVSPALSGGMDAQVSFNIPTQAGNYQYGIYTVTAELTDADGTKFYVSKTIKLCEPDKNNKTRNYGTLSALMSADCKNGKLYVILDNVPTYNGIIAQSQTVSGTLSYPTESELAPASIAIEKFSATLFEGVYKVSGEICALYNYGDNVFVQVKYKYKKEHHARCLIDKCCIYNALVRLHESITEACTEEEKSNVASITVDAIRLLHMIELAAVCGEDPSDYIASLEKLLGCKCTCNCAEGTPVIEQSPSSDVIVEGCNVLAEQTGNTTKYTINNYSYLAEHNANGGVLTVSSQTTEGCVVKQIISFN